MSPRIPILTYHSLDDSGSVLSVSPAVFAQQMRFLRASGVRVISLEEAVAGLGNGRSPVASAVLTFDDGFASVYRHALPVLQRHGFTATVFLVSDYCGKSNGWPGQPPGILSAPLLTWSQIEEMRDAGIRFGSHTRTHPDLTRLSRREAEEEIVSSKRAIEDRLGETVSAFAYPYGAYDDGMKRLAGDHFEVACSTVLGFAGPRSDALALERLDVYYLRRLALFRRLFSPAGLIYLGLRRLLRAGRPRYSAPDALPSNR